MELYDIESLHRYYRGSYVINPETNEVAQCVGADGGSLVLSMGGKRFSVRKERFEWHHVRCPELGYRTHPSGHFVFFAARSAGRTTTKGFNQQNLRLSIPPACVDTHAALGLGIVANTRLQVSEDIAKAVFNPQFVPLGEALTKLAKNPKASGYALSPSWAVCTGTVEGAEYMLYLKGSLVATSQDGMEWDWLDDAARDLFNSSSVR